MHSELDVRNDACCPNVAESGEDKTSGEGKAEVRRGRRENNEARRTRKESGQTRRKRMEEGTKVGVSEGGRKEG